MLSTAGSYFDLLADDLLGAGLVSNATKHAVALVAAPPATTTAAGNAVAPVTDGAADASAGQAAPVGGRGPGRPGIGLAALTSLNEAVNGTTGSADSTATDPTVKSQVAAEYGQVPLSFEANAGQTDPAVAFLSQGAGYSLFLKADGTAVLSLVSGSTSQAATADDPNALSAVPQPESGTAIFLSLVGGAANPTVQALDLQANTSNYFIGSSATWHTDIANYGRVEFQNVYPGIDLVYYGNQGQLEYDFIVHAGADPNAIQLNVAGTQGVAVDASGNLVLHTAQGDLTEHAPVVYQDGSGRRQSIAGHYVDQGNGRVGFAVGAYDPSQALVIDPILSYSTYLGGAGNDGAQGIAVDSAGNAYVTGNTTSANFPTTPGAFQTTLGGNFNAFVTKLNAAGTALVYSTFLGGTDSDFGHGIAVDSAGNAYVTGFTNSTNFPTTPGAFQTVLGGAAGNAFVTKLNAAGTALVYSTYLGGSGGEGGSGIAVDSAGNAYVTGGTSSANFPTTPGAFQTVLGGAAGNAFVTKLNAAGTALVYSTYLGGSGGDGGNGIAVDSAGSAYVTGSTSSTNFPTTPGAFQSALGGPRGNAFVTKLNAVGTALVYSTYLGGSGFGDGGNGIAVDSAGSAYVTGFTTSADFPTTPGAFQTTIGSVDAFVTKLNAAGTALVYSTYLGGSGNDFGFGIAVDSAGDAFVTGHTTSANFPTTPGAFQTGLGGAAGNAFVTKLNAAGSALAYSTYLGGSGDDQGNGIAVDSAGSAYVTGFTQSANFPTTPGAFQTAPGGVQDAFISKFAAPTLTSVNPNSVQVGSPTTTITLTGQDFVSGDFVVFNGTPLATTFISATQLQAVVPAALLSTAGAVQVAVQDPDWGLSNILPFTIASFNATGLFFTDGINELWLSQNGVFTNTGAFAKQLSAGLDANGNPECWFTDGNNQLWRYDNGAFTNTGAFALQLSAGRGMVAFVDGNYQLFTYSDQAGLVTYPAFAVLHIACGFDAAGNNQVAFTDASNRIWLLNPQTQQLMQTIGFASQLSEGRDAAGNLETWFTDANNQVYRLDQGAITPMLAYATKLSASQGQVYFLDGLNQLYALTDAGTGTDLGSFSNALSSSPATAAVYFLDGNNQLWQFQNGAFTQMPGFGEKLAAY